MEIRINDSRAISAIQEEFNRAFPYLKIEFFKHGHRSGEGSPLDDMIPADTNIGSWRTKHGEADFHIDGNMTVEQVEKAMEEKFGIAAQIFRLSGKVWLETTVTDSWTLAEQNDTGKEMQRA